MWETGGFLLEGCAAVSYNEGICFGLRERAVRNTAHSPQCCAGVCLSSVMSGCSAASRQGNGAQAARGSNINR